MANSQQIIIVGEVADREFDNLITETGFRLITDDGLSFLALESGGGLTLHSSEIAGVSDYKTTIRLLGRITLSVDLANSQQVVGLPELNQVLKVGTANSSQTIRLQR